MAYMCSQAGGTTCRLPGNSTTRPLNPIQTLDVTIYAFYSFSLFRVLHKPSTILECIFTASFCILHGPHSIPLHKLLSILHLDPFFPTICPPLYHKRWKISTPKELTYLNRLHRKTSCWDLQTNFNRLFQLPYTIFLKGLNWVEKIRQYASRYKETLKKPGRHPRTLQLIRPPFSLCIRQTLPAYCTFYLEGPWQMVCILWATTTNLFIDRRVQIGLRIRNYFLLEVSKSVAAYLIACFFSMLPIHL